MGDNLDTKFFIVTVKGVVFSSQIIRFQVYQAKRFETKRSIENAEDNVILIYLNVSGRQKPVLVTFWDIEKNDFPIYHPKGDN